MKWDKPTKLRLYEVLSRKSENISRPEWEIFLESYGIIRVERGDGDAYCSRPAWEELGFGDRMVNRKRIIIKDPFFDRLGAYYYGLSISKDVAERFLVLGVP